ncbi:hypothetical protein E3N88_14021 [Mikania micrantha]|uniref:Uncharacterized protein n=1 Tax=Mikania micrantha TaxID=192012 RepID=A0A5N6P1Z2_9ASTR|nr:hypothetical protein E3N88_14021 [Mikania micrantha]
MFEDIALTEYEDLSYVRRAAPAVKPTVAPPIPTRGLHRGVEDDKLRDQKTEEHDTLLRNQQAGFLDLQRSVGELAKRFDERPGVSFRTNTDPNPRGHVKAVTTHSGRGGDVELPPPVIPDDDEPVDEDIELGTPAGVPLRLDTASTAPSSESSVERLKREKVKEKKRGKRVAEELEIDLTKLPYPARALQLKRD